MKLACFWALLFLSDEEVGSLVCEQVGEPLLGIRFIIFGTYPFDAPCVASCFASVVKFTWWDFCSYFFSCVLGWCMVRWKWS